MKTIFALLGFVFACLFAHAQGEPYDEQIAAFCNNAATGGGATTASWTPTYAIQMNLTNATQYTDCGVYPQKGWDVRMLVNVRSNSGPTAATGAYWVRSFMMNGAASYYASYGDQQSAAGSSYAYGSWMLVRMATTNLDMVISTNGIMVAGVTATVVSTNTTDTFKVGANLVVQSGSMKWNVARIQLIRWDGVLQKDLIATANGTFTNVADGAVVNFGVSGTGGTSADSINVQGQNFPPPTMMNWK